MSYDQTAADQLTETKTLRAEIERLRGIVPEVLERLNDELCSENEMLRAGLQECVKYMEDDAHTTLNNWQTSDMSQRKAIGMLSRAKGYRAALAAPVHPAEAAAAPPQAQEREIERLRIMRPDVRAVGRWPRCSCGSRPRSGSVSPRGR